MRAARAFIDQLIQQGIRLFCVAPGSRSAPLIEAAASHPAATTKVHYDERGLAFYALGYGKALGRPAALITTSGTAAANLLPAVMEAHHSCTPLLLLTADRPHELRECGANQTTDQVKIFASFVRWQMDLASDLNENAVRSIAAEGVFQSMQNPAGPVHFNLPCREPLYVPLENGKEEARGKKLEMVYPRLRASPLKTSAKRGVIVLGQMEDPGPALRLAKRLSWPVFADLLSQARCTPTEEQIRYFDFLIREGEGIPSPDFILHLGGSLVSKEILEWQPQVPYWHVSPSPFLQDPSRRLSQRVQGEISSFCDVFQTSGEGAKDWLQTWREKDVEVAVCFEEKFSRSPWTEAHLYRQLPARDFFFLGNGLAVRNCDHFFFPERCRRFFANRGLSGIDGNIATTAGIAAGIASSDAPLLAILGDQAALHDLNSLPLLIGKPVLLVILNNRGGGIFEHLPIAGSRHFETHFAATHSWSFKTVANMFGLSYVRWENGVGSHWPDSGVVEIVTDRKENARFQQGLREILSHAITI